MTSGVLLTPAPRQAEGKQEEQDRAAQLQTMVHHLRHAQAALSEAQLDQANVHDLCLHICMYMCVNGKI
jgi:hypothetical protein